MNQSIQFHKQQLNLALAALETIEECDHLTEIGLADNESKAARKKSIETYADAITDLCSCAMPDFCDEEVEYTDIKKQLQHI